MTGHSRKGHREAWKKNRRTCLWGCNDEILPLSTAGHGCCVQNLEEQQSACAWFFAGRKKRPGHTSEAHDAKDNSYQCSGRVKPPKQLRNGDACRSLPSLGN